MVRLKAIRGGEGGGGIWGGGGVRSQPGSSPVSLEAVTNNRLLVVYQ